jgi:hypothetical protein
MKSIRLLYLYFMMQLFGMTSFVYAEDVSQSFTIQEGVVTITPARCTPESCAPTSADLAGTLDAEIAGDAIAFTSTNVSSMPETGFILPEAPNESSGGAIQRASFSFDGMRLVVSGSVDSRAFDGPLQTYKFTALISKGKGFDAYGYYTARQDTRRCISPLCGGIFVKSVNKRLTKCPDGMLLDECYVATANWDELGSNPFNANTGLYINTPILLKGKLISNIYERFGNLGEFVATEAYRPATNNLAKGTFAALENNGIICVTTPCFSIDESELNTGVTRLISGFDLNPAGASEKDVSTAYSLFAHDSPLIVAGHNRKQEELHGIGVSFIANQFYLPMQPNKQCYESVSEKSVVGAPTLNIKIVVSEDPKIAEGVGTIKWPSLGPAFKDFESPIKGPWYFMCTMKSCRIRFDFSSAPGAKAIKGILVLDDWGAPGTFEYKFAGSPGVIKQQAAVCN